MFSSAIALFYSYSALYCNYRPRSRGDNAFGSIRLSVCLSVCMSVCLYVCLFELSCLNRLTYNHRVFISRSIQNGWAFKIIFVSTCCAIAVDQAFNSFAAESLTLWGYICLQVRYTTIFGRVQNSC